MTQNPTQSAPPQGMAPQQTSVLDDTFARLRASGYRREGDGRWFGGVCAGLAGRWGVDPVLIRAAAIVLTFAGGLGITAYLVLWLLLPDPQGDILGERAIRHGDVLPVILLVVASVFVVGGLVSIGSGDSWATPLWLIPIAVIVWLAVRHGRSGPQLSGPPAGTAPTPYPPTPAGAQMSSTAPPYAAPPASPYPPRPGAPMPGPYAGAQATGPYGGYPAPPRPPRPIAPPPPPRPRRRRPSGYVALVSLGIAIAGFGLGAALADPLGFPGSGATLGFAIALGGVSVLLLALGLSGRAAGFSGFVGFVLTVGLLGASAASHVEVGDGMGERTWLPVAGVSRTSYSLGVGQATLDLRNLDTGTTGVAGGLGSPARVDAEMGAGNLRIVVPDDVTARIEAEVGAGTITRPGLGEIGTTVDSGPGRELTTVIGDGPTEVVVTAQLGLGEISIIEEN